MILVSKQRAGLLLRFIVFVRPALPWISIYTAVCGVAYFSNEDSTYGLLHLAASVVGVLCYLVTQHDWE